MDRWAKLYRKFNDVVSEQEQRARRALAEATARAKFEAWSEWANEEAVRVVSDLLTRRAQEFEQQTGNHVDVRVPREPPVEMGQGGPRMSFIRAELSNVTVDLYSHCEPGTLPVLHLVRRRMEPEQEPASRRRHVVISVPVCTVFQRPDNGWELRRVGSSGRATSDGALMDPDELVFDLFEMLVHEVEKVRASSAGIAPSEPPR